MPLEEGSGHLDHLLRQTRMHHIDLSAMADVKANILLTMATVVLTLSIRYISDPLLKWPIIILIACCLMTIVLATYAVMPKVPARIKPGKHPKIDFKHFNPLFFGDFARLTYEEFQAAMLEVMVSPKEVYLAQLREIYLLGTFLARKKYRFVRLAYIAFIVGILACGIAIIIMAILATE